MSEHLDNLVAFKAGLVAERRRQVADAVYAVKNKTNNGAIVNARKDVADLQRQISAIDDAIRDEQSDRSL
jgi:hypothetical protein